ncbi:MAG: metal-dependent hydrolase [Anaerolineales bacterium]|nr:metal-dependent hydrolase [Anaerolineales bacterium]MCB0007418.1 metal-dependent hydrolase [Anaerolineales bacterium]MCB0012148.1 metal-dependent hydrolase [Anaerolineales bacterium]MCB0027067.1 metal-dependent hydrolase [Anaerolineales bacterium]
MQTVSHLITTLAGGRWLAQRRDKISVGWLVAGAVVPDIPFTLLTVGYEIYYRQFAALPVSGQSIMEYLHFDLFFNDPLWIVSHNLFHSLIINGFLMLMALTLFKGRRWGRGLFWFAVGATIHTIIDILTHHSDGPLFLFPLNWHYRFASPVSYWEEGFYGRQFMVFEYTMNLLALLYLGRLWLRGRQARR